MEAVMHPPLSPEQQDALLQQAALEKLRHQLLASGGRWRICGTDEAWVFGELSRHPAARQVLTSLDLDAALADPAVHYVLLPEEAGLPIEQIEIQARRAASDKWLVLRLPDAE